MDQTIHEMDGQEDGPEESALDRLAREAGDPELFPPEVRRLWEQGKGRKARKALLKAAKTERRQDRARRQMQHAGDFRLWLEPLRKAPPMTTLNGVGTHLYGKYQPEDDGSYIATLWFVLLFLPLWPLSSYLVVKAESRGWHFLARSPRPPAAQMMQRLVIAVVVALAGLGAMAIYDAETHADVLVYNGFDQPVDVMVAEETRRLGAKKHATFADLVAGPTQFAAGFPDSEAFESLDVDLSSHAHDTVIYNVGGRALLSMDYVRYGKGEAKEGRWLESGPIILLKEDIDYAFVPPPESKKIREGGYVENSILGDAELVADPVTLLNILTVRDKFDQAQQFGLAILRAHPENAQVARFVALATMDDPKEQRELFRGLIERAPDEIDLHRGYQDLWPDDDNQPVVEEYRARLESDPASAVNHYLMGRLLDHESSEGHYREAMRLDPDFDYPHLALGYRAAQLGRYREALDHYGRYADFGPEQSARVLDARVRLLRTQGGDATALDSLLAEAAAASEQDFQLESQRRHLWLESGRMQLDQAIEEMDGLAAEWFGSEPGSPQMAAARADLALTAGDLERARAELETFAETGDRSLWVEYRLALSQGATPEDHDRLRAGDPSWLAELTASQSLAILDLLDSQERATHLESLGDPKLVEFARLLEDAGTLREPDSVAAAVATLDLGDRCAAYLAAARALEGEADSRSRRAQSEYLKRAWSHSVPGEMPFVRL